MVSNAVQWQMTIVLFIKSDVTLFVFGYNFGGYFP